MSFSSETSACSECGESLASATRAVHESECVKTAPYLWPSGSALLSWQQERDEINVATASVGAPVLNQPFFVVSFPWLSSWREYASGGGTRPPPIGNADLLDEEKGGGRIRKGVVANYDFEVVAAPVWLRLHAWYGGGPAILRRAVRSGVRVVVDLFPVTFRFSVSEEKTQRTAVLASNNTLRMMRHWVATKANTPPGRCEIGFVKTDGGSREVAWLKDADLKTTIEELGLPDSIELEVKSNTADNFVAGHGVAMSSFAMKPAENEVGMPLARGVAGLHNLGNTCFMNSTLQCLSAVPPVVSYFLDVSFKQLLNVKGNAMSTKGELALALQRVLEDLWCGQYRVVAPAAFRAALSQWAPQFRGYQQHDAQEALLVTLNLLHEDLCNLQSKAEVTAAAAAGGPTVLAASPIASLFGGTYRSELTCDACGQKSFSFEPFLNFPLPVPEKEHRKLAVTFFPLHGTPVHLGVRVSKMGNSRHVFLQLAELLGQPGLEARVVGVQLSGHSGVYEMGEQKMVGSFRDRDRALVFECVADPEWRTVTVFSFRPNAQGQRVAVCGVPVACSVKVSDSGQQAVERIREKIGGVIGAVAQAADVRVLKFNGPIEESTELPLKSVLTAPCVAMIWTRDTADAIAKSYERIQEDASCKPDAGDRELTVPLRDCFTMAGAPESLSLAEAWKCPTCKVARSAVKIMSLWRAPPVLCLQLKRFKMDFVSREKLHTLVTFPQELNVAEFVAGPDVPQGSYRLVSVCNHVGGLSGGHYTAFANVGSEWYDLNDRACARISEDKVVSPSAYVLYYVHESVLGSVLPPMRELDAVQASAAAAAAVAASEASSSSPGKSATQRLEPLPAAAKKVKSEDSDTSCDMSMSPVPSHEAHHGRDDHYHHQRESLPMSQPMPLQEELNLSDSQYLCDICSAGVTGGWAGLTRHAREQHGVEY